MNEAGFFEQKEGEEDSSPFPLPRGEMDENERNKFIRKLKQHIQTMETLSDAEKQEKLNPKWIIKLASRETIQFIQEISQNEQEQEYLTEHLLRLPTLDYVNLLLEKGLEALREKWISPNALAAVCRSRNPSFTLNHLDYFLRRIGDEGIDRLNWLNEVRQLTEGDVRDRLLSQDSPGNVC